MPLSWVNSRLLLTCVVLSLFFIDGLFFHIRHAPSHKGHKCPALMLMREPSCQEQFYLSLLPWLLEENIHCVEGIIKSQPQEFCNQVLPTVLCKWILHGHSRAQILEYAPVLVILSSFLCPWSNGLCPLEFSSMPNEKQAIVGEKHVQMNKFYLSRRGFPKLIANILLAGVQPLTNGWN